MRSTPTRRQRADFKLFLVFALIAIPPSVYIAIFCRNLAASHFSLQYFKDVSRVWQGALGGGFTLEAAFVGGFFVFQQTRSQAERKEQDRERRLRSERITLKFTLAALVTYTEDSAAYVCDILDAVKSKRLNEQPGRAPSFPEALVYRLADLVTLAPDHITQLLDDALQVLQIQNARSDDLRRSRGFPQYQPPNETEVLRLLALTALVHSQLRLLFDWSRNYSEAAGPSRQRHMVHASAQTLLKLRPDVDGLTEEINNLPDLTD